MKRAYPASRFCLDLENTMSGWLLSADGGQASTEQVKGRTPGGHSERKFVGVTKFEDITLTCGAGMSDQFYDWLKSSLDYDHQYHSGAIIAADFDYKEVNRLNFSRGLVTEFGLPALDSKKNESCSMTVKIAPEETRMEFSPQRSRSIMPAGNRDPIQKRWLCSAFRLTIDDDKLPCENVITIDALTFKQKTIDNPAGETRYPDKHPVNMEFPDLVITIPESDAEPWYKWHREFVVDGKSDPSFEKKGQLEFLTANRQDVLFTLQFPVIGITKFQPEKLDSKSDKIRTVKITMYLENTTFEYSSEATWA